MSNGCRLRFKRIFESNGKDVTISVLIDWVKKVERPSSEQMEGASREIRYYKARYDKLTSG